MIERPPIPFAPGMMSDLGSPPFLAFVFGDGAAVFMHSVKALAVGLGLTTPNGSLFELLQDWDRTFPTLSNLVEVLANDERASGNRSQFVAENLLSVERLLPEARQIIRIGAEGARLLPHALQVGGSTRMWRRWQTSTGFRCTVSPSAVSRSGFTPRPRGSCVQWQSSTMTNRDEA